MYLSGPRQAVPRGYEKMHPRPFLSFIKAVKRMEGTIMGLLGKDLRA